MEPLSAEGLFVRMQKLAPYYYIVLEGPYWRGDKEWTGHWTRRPESDEHSEISSDTYRSEDAQAVLLDVVADAEQDREAWELEE